MALGSRDHPAKRQRTNHIKMNNGFPVLCGNYVWSMISIDPDSGDSDDSATSLIHVELQVGPIQISIFFQIYDFQISTFIIAELFAS